jgi:hypothetical protein
MLYTYLSIGTPHHGCGLLPNGEECFYIQELVQFVANKPV